MLTQRIIGAAITVHPELGPGFLESIYEEALAVEFALQGIAFVRQRPVPLFYKDHQIGEHRLDFLVEDLIVVELKAIRALENIHFAIGRSYLKATGLQGRPALQFRDLAPNDQTLLPRTSRNSDDTMRLSSNFPAFLLS